MTRFYTLSFTLHLILGLFFNVTSEPDYHQFEMILSRYVSSDGLVDYASLQSEKEQLNLFIHSLNSIKHENFSTWNEKSQIAFLINGYNACVLQIIVNHYPIRPRKITSFLYPINSIMQIPGAFDRISFSIAGMQLTINQMESLLQKNYSDPRFYFAIVNGSRSSPSLRQEPYTGEELDFQLEDQVVRFLRSYQNLRVNPIEGKLFLSSMLKRAAKILNSYYGNDELFPKMPASRKGVILFISKYLSDYDRQMLLSGQLKIVFRKTDWALNQW